MYAKSRSQEKSTSLASTPYCYYPHTVHQQSVLFARYPEQWNHLLYLQPSTRPTAFEDCNVLVAVGTDQLQWRRVPDSERLHGHARSLNLLAVSPVNNYSPALLCCMSATGDPCSSQNLFLSSFLLTKPPISNGSRIVSTKFLLSTQPGPCLSVTPS